ncbi:ABC transporter permease subunit [Modestobacter sp. I12A-02628]|uniref:Sugar ABC transporter permease n=1 Tax=Goekera deserti TaxID=2497753 RepID=A0A7K3WIW5_9ACTN|nr:sugar ABC transporter permease [Goekera deserti]MPQ96628.1 ABC transporter permease subunit [Goekera deserti]NDI47060.1 ABC transporter permease subunit [Goekera deserti]NEL56296.1 sugar ABC transporter permease [Goekera deserti]
MASLGTADQVASSAAAATATGGRPRPEARKQLKGRGTNAWVAWAFLAPFALVFLVFLVAPLLYALYLSLYTKGLATGERFAGLDNYTRAFTDPSFLNGIWFVLRFTLVVIPVQMAVSLLAALVLDSLTSRFSRFSRLVIFVPYAIPAVIGALMWGFLYSPNFGPLQQIFGDSAPFLLADGGLFAGLTNVVTWQWAGYYMIIIYAALQGIDPAIYEAAKIDGATGLQVALRIKIPMVSSALVLILVFAVIGTLQFFTEPQVLRPISNGGITADITPNVYAFNLAFNYAQVNYASAIAFALGIVVFLGVYIFLFATRKRGGFLK